MVGAIFPMVSLELFTTVVGGAVFDVVSRFFSAMAL